MSNETGGNAYPQNTVYIAANGAVAQSGPQGGMTLRDYFAAQMLASVMSATSRSIPDPKMIATACYKVADAMLEARK